ncbi:hypothetical protein M8C21_010711 [Ambrosia artemisiifolia]|uniref:Uncharacterized protein n=1 Tax=Ambrosia artemisiifolia TaxID=4212 RepID=A0AAD5CCB4_AMBAR|nr:hypothetical protein M8C21_010711 [Ambrosia artemisiifolia]
MESLVGQSRARRLDASPIKTQQGPQEYTLHQLLEIRKLTAVLSLEGKRRWEYGNTVRETIIANVPVVHNHKVGRMAIKMQSIIQHEANLEFW